MKVHVLCAMCCVAVTSTACVSQGKYDQAVAEGQRYHQQRDALQKRATAAELNYRNLQTACEVISARARDQEAKLTGLHENLRTLQKQLDESTAIQAQLRAELTKLGKNADSLLQEKGVLSYSLEQARQRLDELRRAQLAAEQRAALFRDLAVKLKSMVDAGELKIVLRDGRMVLQLPNEVLFDSGRTNLKPNGKEALSTIAVVLKSVNARDFQVAGHTDSVPIQTQRFASNWELSAARALEVVHLLIAQGVAAERLSAAGYGEFDPVSPNDTAQGRQANRRTEITVQPNIDEFVAVP